ncbi:hypothetical protein Y1Q_0010461 [Alligator mississippiensis]|uniref:Uncharacterized protein n=1 Tax=Alligator mississippiensis TaxID=8496 RepID=A0A151P6K9_ALLMI|nr:hypothetical protein Y1Q_0010461 [Alligator mississippiensis]
MTSAQWKMDAKVVVATILARTFAVTLRRTFESRKVQGEHNEEFKNNFDSNVFAREKHLLYEIQWAKDMGP